jgi:ABC-type Fe3+-hydroxamate transport system substrate-binding protein
MSANYTAQGWANGSGGGTPLSAARLLYMEAGIEAVDNAAIAGLAGKASTASVAAKSDATRTINAQTGTSYTLALGDADDIVTMNNAAANTLTVPPNGTIAFPIGTVIDVVQIGAGATTITQGAGVTIDWNDAGTPGTGNKALNGQRASATLVKTGTDAWLLIGSLA